MTEAIGGLAVKVDLQIDTKEWDRTTAAMRNRGVGDAVRRDVAATSQATAEASSAMDERWGTAIASMRTAAVAGFAAAAAAMGGFTAHVFDSAVAIDRQARSLGVSTDEIQRMRYAAEQAGLEGNELGEAMGGLVSRVQAAAEGGGDAAARFREMGLEIQGANGETLSADQLFRNAADSLAAMGPGTEQTAAAIALFGEKGRLLLPVLSQGSAGLHRLGAEFDELGGGLDADTIASVQRTQREFERIKLAMTAAVLPAVQGIIGALEEFSRKARPMIADIRTWITDSHNIRTVTIALTGAVAALGIASARSAAATIVAWAPVIGTIAAVGAGIAGAALLTDDLITTFDGGDSVIKRFIDSLAGVGTTQAWVTGLRGAMFDLFEVAERLEGAFSSVGASIQESISGIGETIANTVNQTLDSLAVAANAAGVDTTGTPLSAEAIAQRRIEQAQRIANSGLRSGGLRADAAESDRRANTIAGAQSTFATGTNPFITAANAQTSIATAQVPNAKSVNVQSRTQVQITGLVQDETLIARIQEGIRTANEETNAKALGDLVDEGDG